MHNIGTSERPDLPLAVVVGAGAMALAIARRLGVRNRLLIADKVGENAARAAEALNLDGHDAVAAVCDVTDAAAVAALASRAAEIGPMRVLAHVVGLSPTMGDWRSIMDVDLLGARRVADAMLPAAGQGTSAIFISSNAAQMVSPDAATLAVLDEPLAEGFHDRLQAALGGSVNSVQAYCLAKAALNRMCQRLAPAWGARGARIVSLSPGMIASPMARLEWKHQPIKYDMLAITPLAREGTLLEIAATADFLASDGASFISGVDILVDGGLTAASRHMAAPPKIKEG